ncbi:TIGR02444 family protein [Marinicauda pacifica]|uniref:TIGR02444 family protein n=1 Tax=Marinicauda pacifica TaxID=1133559 RepID=UPI0035C7CE59
MNAPDEFWSFSTGVYAGEGVPAACLAFQSEGLDVNLGLWICWVAARGGEPLDGLDAAMALSAPWKQQVVEPLRAARNGLKPAPDGFEGEEAQALRRTILKAELEAERLQQARLEPLGLACGPAESQDEKSGEGGGRARAEAGLRRYAGTQVDRVRIAAFAERIFSALEKM